MKKITIVILLIIFSTTPNNYCRAQSTIQSPLIFSNFEKDQDYWTSEGGELTYLSSMGNPNGFLSLKDTDTNCMFLIAPQKFLGDLTKFNNGIISFDAKMIENPDGTLDSIGKVTLYNDNYEPVSKDIITENLGNTWKTYHIILNTSTWWENNESEWLSFLSNIKKISINLEGGSKVTETVGFDNFKIIPPSTDETCSMNDYDGDHVIDLWDKCPNQASKFIDINGCPVIKGDMNDDGKLGLEDIIISLHTLSTPLQISENVIDQIDIHVKNRGINLCGAEFGENSIPGVYDKDYIYPNSEELDYYKSNNFGIVRLPFLWERLQPELFGELNIEELNHLDNFINEIQIRDMKCIISPHNFARYNKNLIGTTDVPITAFKDFWIKIAKHFKNSNGIYAYGLMNEPHDTDGHWPEAAQSAIDGIRTIDMNHYILVPGDGWSAAHNWLLYNSNFEVNDPANKFMYEAHQYFDNDNSGRYLSSYDNEKAYPLIGVDRVSIFINWLKEKNAQGYIGEYGVPNNDSRWLVVLEYFLTYLDDNRINCAYWAGGPWLEDYPLSIEPKKYSTMWGVQKPQMIVVNNKANQEKIVLLEPTDNSEEDLNMTFKWHILNRKSNITYTSTIYTDKGSNPFDTNYEDKFDAGNQSHKSVSLDDYYYTNVHFQWGVKVISSEGNIFYSEIWDIDTE